MTETFRHRRAAFRIAQVFTVFFLFITVATITLHLVDDPVGQKTPLSQKALGGALYFSVFGSLTILSLYKTIAYHRERITLTGTQITYHSIFGNQTIDASEVTRLAWNDRRDRVDFHTPCQRMRIGLSVSYTTEDRLRMIRLFHQFIPNEKQLDWAKFCCWVALPLRKSLSPPAEAAIKEPAIQAPPSPTQVLITRKRYDRIALVIIPATLVAAIIPWMKYAKPGALGVPIFLAVNWLLIRRTVPREGQIGERLSSTPGGRSLSVGIAIMVISVLTGSVLRLKDYSHDTSCDVAILILLAGFPFIVYGLVRSAEAEKLRSEARAILAAQEWSRGEPPEWRT